MKPDEVKDLIIRSLDTDADPGKAARKLEEEALSYNFREGFTDRVVDKIFKAGVTFKLEIEFVRNMNFIFKRIALTGIAAIVILLISIFIAQGSLSLNSVLGISNPDIESMVCLLTGN